MGDAGKSACPETTKSGDYKQMGMPREEAGQGWGRQEETRQGIAKGEKSERLGEVSHQGKWVWR